MEKVKLEWVSAMKQAPPINEEVYIKYIYNNRKILNIDKLVHMGSNTYIWAYGDYNDCHSMYWARKIKNRLI